MSRFDDAFTAGGIIFEVKNAGSVKILCFFFDYIDEPGAEILFSFAEFLVMYNR